MDELVNQGVVINREALCKQFIRARPFRHIVIENFLEAGFAQSLLDNFPEFDEKLAINENGEVGGKAVHEKVPTLGRVWKKLDQLVAGETFRSLITDITGVPDLKFDPHYFGGGTHENLQGQGLNPHIDFNFHPITRQHRRLNLILYLSPEWKQEWGGSIQLHRDPYLPPAEDDIITVTPAFNRCVIFETNEHSWHGFKRINLPEDKRHLSRKSFALYYYTDSRPAEELGAEHSTIYVEEHLPEHYEAGMTLGADELQHIRNLMASRDQHLKRLYADIMRLNTSLGDLQYRLKTAEEIEIVEPDENDSVELLNLKKHVAQLQLRVHDLENSSSWRITRPLRALKRAFTHNG